MMTRFPLADLLALLPGRSDRDLLGLLGCSLQTFRRWQTEGLSVIEADTAAVRAGFVAMVVWPDWPGDLPACDGCGEPTIPQNPWYTERVYCSTECRRAFRAALRRSTRQASSALVPSDS